MGVMPFNASAAGAARRGGKTPPPDETFEEANYLKLLGEKQKPVSIKESGASRLKVSGLDMEKEQRNTRSISDGQLLLRAEPRIDDP